ncbi:LSU ribosomal protein L9p [Candidatus Karelsulcia muelleri]|uniref:Large ribosomal subunit protein bL9 n=1 Tax=Candidatus Karelsulcia muelleri TaxID=336810 RepID=A0A654MF90_9FLAO|nr:50S ribosomal L9 C-terminal domain-containing protein [Candidatus Karelsulcia muelleri]AGS33403.1 50S ribosomal subunit protein L9 [Candidatus Karelsulcia muelleri str. Sulcia-ALF]ALP70143.1 LSU ribosomal protein L9p [Candidatus Karelsulcia muelleri]QND78389.1 LSU ribosomal protein L9 [Candidatus Karelsulcia muelleri]
MNIILKKNIFNLGNKYDQVNVKPGYARNFLFPKGYAIFSNKNLPSLKHEKIIKQFKKIKKKFLFKKDNCKLLGSITSKNISNFLSSKSIEVEKKSIFIKNKTIQNLGIFKCIIYKFNKIIKLNFKISYKKNIKL